MLKKALRNLIDFGGNTGIYSKLRSRGTFRSSLSLEPLEDRRLLAAFDLSGYESHLEYKDSNDTLLPGTAALDFSGIVYHEPSQSFFIVDNKQNSNNGKIHEYKYEEEVIEGETVLRMQHQTREIDFKNFDEGGGNPREGDPEGITWMGGDKFAFVREQLGFIHEFWIDADGTVDTESPPLVDGDSNSDDITDEIDKNGGSISTITPNPDPSRDNNVSLEGIAYDDDRDVFYVVKESSWLDIDSANGTEIIYEVETDGTVTPIVVSGLTTHLAGRDVSDVYYDDDQIFLLTESGTNQITRITWNSGTSAWEFTSTDDDDVLSGITGFQPEGITFSKDGFDMFVVGEPREFFHYRNYTSFTPNAAPDLDNDTNDITNDPTPTFSGTLTRTVGGNTVPVDAASVWLYVDGVKTGVAAETDVNGNYSVTAAALADGTYDFTIKVSEKNDFATAIFSIESAKLEDVQIFYADLTDNGFVDFEDLTILLANWNQNVSAAEGNLVDPTTTPVNFEDLTVLLAAWTGPSPAGAPQLAWAAPSVEHDSETVYSTSTEFKVQFNLPVSGVDVTDLVLSGTGGSGATVDSVTDYAMLNIYGFHVSGLSIGTVDVDLAPDTDDITYVTGGAWIGLKEWTFIALPGVTFTAGALDIDGSSGADTITVAASGGDLTLNGAKVDMGSGDILASAVTSIDIDGLAGNDTIDLSAVTSTYFTGAGLSGNITVNGGTGGDNITGSAFADSLYGDGDDDFMYGGDGNDFIDGGGGADTLYGDGDNDFMYGGDGNDFMNGGGGADTLYGDAGDDLMYGGAGNDYIDGGDDDDNIFGEAGDDTLYGGAGNDYIDGGDDDDDIFGEAGDDTLYGGNGVDTIRGGSEDDLIFGDAGNDWLYGDAGADILHGGAGSDTLDAGGDPGDEEYEE